MIDRLDELRQAAQLQGGSSRRSREPLREALPTPQLQPFRREPLTAFLSKLERVRLGPFSDLEGALQEAEEVHRAALQATTATAEKQASRRPATGSHWIS